MGHIPLLSRSSEESWVGFGRSLPVVTCLLGLNLALVGMASGTGRDRVVERVSTAEVHGLVVVDLRGVNAATWAVDLALVVVALQG